MDEPARPLSELIPEIEKLYADAVVIIGQELKKIMPMMAEVDILNNAHMILAKLADVDILLERHKFS